MSLLLASIAAIFVFAIDRASKTRALALAPAFTNGFVRVRCIVNRGGLLRIKPGSPLILAWLVCMAAACAAVLHEPFAARPFGAFGIGMIAGGVSGNFRDLQTRNGVVDFIAVGSLTIFNLADCAILCGIGLAVLAVA